MEIADPTWIKVFVLDMQLSDKGVVVLMAALNPNISQDLHYALGKDRQLCHFLNATNAIQELLNLFSLHQQQIAIIFIRKVNCCCV